MIGSSWTEVRLFIQDWRLSRFRFTRALFRHSLRAIAQFTRPGCAPPHPDQGTNCPSTARWTNLWLFSRC